MMFTPCWPSAGPIGGAGVAWPALICSLMRAETLFFLGGMVPGPFPALVRGVASWGGAWRRRGAPDPGSDLGDVRERQLDRRLPAEDRDEHLELLRVRVDLGDRRGQGLEGALHDGDCLADLEVDDLDLGRPRGLRLGRPQRGP